MLAKYLVQPRVGHMDQALHVFAYLKMHDRSTMAFDNSLPVFDESQFICADWMDFYKDAKEALPPNAPEARWNIVTIHCFVDADHAGDHVTRRSQTEILIFINRALIIWYSKWQNTVETSMFGSEFVAILIAMEMIEALHYKWRVFGVQIDGPMNVFCDNKALVQNSTRPETMIKKKHNSIAYHHVREAIAAKVL